MTPDPRPRSRRRRRRTLITRGHTEPIVECAASSRRREAAAPSGSHPRAVRAPLSAADRDGAGLGAGPVHARRPSACAVVGYRARARASRAGTQRLVRRWRSYGEGRAQEGGVMAPEKAGGTDVVAARGGARGGARAGRSSLQPARTPHRARSSTSIPGSGSLLHIAGLIDVARRRSRRPNEAGPVLQARHPHREFVVGFHTASGWPAAGRRSGRPGAAVGVVAPPYRRQGVLTRRRPRSVATSACSAWSSRCRNRCRRSPLLERPTSQRSDGRHCGRPYARAREPRGRPPR